LGSSGLGGVEVSSQSREPEGGAVLTEALPELVEHGQFDDVAVERNGLLVLHTRSREG
jgi:hypothetical protein